MTDTRRQPLPTDLPLTRRRLLQAFGALGGSSLVMGAMDAWGLMGAASGAQPELGGSGDGTSVVILGAGLSGLVSAYELGRLGYDCRVLEARDWVGGLCWTVRRGAEHTEVGGERQVCQFDEGQYLNAGAWRIPNRDSGVLGYCKTLGVRLELFVNTSDANYFYDERPSLGSLANRKLRLREVRADLWGSSAELLAKAMDQGQIDVELTGVDRERLIDFLVRAGYLDSDALVYTPPNSRGSAEPYDLARLLESGFGNRAAILYAGTGGPDPVFQPIGGMMQIPLAFQRVLGDSITLNAEVRSVRQSPDGVRIAYAETATGEEHEATADYCLCCLPMSIIQRLDIDLSPEMSSAVNETGHSTAAKMGLQMKRRFWEEDDGIFGGHLWARDLQLGEFSYPSNDYFADKGVLLGFYGDGHAAGLAEGSMEQRVAHVLTQAGKVHPQIRDEFESAYGVWWENVPYSLGAYGRTPSADLLSTLTKPDGRIYLASAGASSRPAWLEGAIQSAWRSVTALHERVMQA